MKSHHDMGGQPGARVEPAEHDYEYWERRIDAMAVLLWGLKGTKKFLTVDEHRNAIESLPPQAYDALAYYEKWIVALSECLLRRGVITSEELAVKMRDVAWQRAHHDLGGRPAARVEPAEHDYEDWERRVDALMVLLAGITGGRKLMTIDERRNNVERLPPHAYDTMLYYERMIESMTLGMLQRGLITTEELARKMVEVQGRD